MWGSRVSVSLWVATAWASWATVSTEAMSTRVDLSLPAEDAEKAELAWEVFATVEAQANEWREDSPIGRVNARAPQAVVVPEDVFALVQRGVELGALTGGAFDISWAALWGLWDFSTPGPVPDARECARRAAQVDYTRIELDPEQLTVRLPEGMKIGLGGLAKGHALDRAAAALRAAGVRDFALSAGGQVLASGEKDGRPWRGGVRDPRGAPDDYFALLDASNTSVSTSGDYERYFEHDGVRYHHILDPRTGLPARGLRSATVVSADATLADALATALMVLGRDEGLRLVAELKGTEAVVVDDHGRVFSTDGLQLTLAHAPLP